MTKDEVLKLALEALENSIDLVREDAYKAEKLYGNYPTRQGKVNGLKVLADDHEKAITAIEEALAQPEQEPTGMLDIERLDKWLNASLTGRQKRTPLTDEQIETIWRRVQANDFHDCVQPFARAIEAAHGIKENT